MDDDAKSDLRGLLSVNVRITTAHILKKAFDRVWDYQTMGCTEPYLRKWCGWTQVSESEPLQRFARGVLREPHIQRQNGGAQQSYIVRSPQDLRDAGYRLPVAENAANLSAILTQNRFLRKILDMIGFPAMMESKGRYSSGSAPPK